MESVEEVKRKSKDKESRYGRRYGFEIKLRCVKLHLEEGLPLSLLSKEAGPSTDGIRRWVRAYQERGEAGLRNERVFTGSRRKLPAPVREEKVSVEIVTYSTTLPGGYKAYLQVSYVDGKRYIDKSWLDKSGQ